MKSTTLLLALACALSLLVLSPACVLGAQPSSGRIDPSLGSVSFYDQLGVTRIQALEPATLKKAYRKLALLHHPDKATSESDKAQKQAFFVRIAQAYDILSDPRTKARYDYLVSQGQLEYDANRDWSDFDVSQGFKRLPKTAAQKQAASERKAAEERYRQAEAIFKKAQEEAEEFALWTALAIAGGIALLPAIYMYFSRKASIAAEETKRKGRSSELKSSQAILLELQEEKDRQKKIQQEEERQYARELRQAREEAAAEAAAAGQTSGSPVGEEWEVLDGAAKDDAADNKDEDASSDDEADTGSKKGGGAAIKCTLCKKSFKSQQQMENHEQSNQHKKALKDASKPKKSRRDE